jgi:hypothetical protein
LKEGKYRFQKLPKGLFPFMDHPFEVVRCCCKQNIGSITNNPL